MIKICRKRNGQHVDFDVKFIEAAIEKAQEATGEKTKSAKDIAKTAVLVIEQDYVDEDGIVDVEECQEAAEKALFINGLFDTLMAYHEYRKAHNEVRNLEVKKEWAKSVTEGYVGAPVIDDITDMTSDSVNNPEIRKEGQSWRVKQNASVSYSIGGNVLNQSSMITEEYWLDTLYDPEIAAYHRQKKFHLHDLGWLGGYCAGWNLKTLIEKGIVGVPGKISSGPAHHLQALCNQMTNFLGIMQNEWAGAQAFSSFDTYLAPFVKADNMSYKEVKQAIQSFVFGINTPSRWGCQAPFSNITLDWTIPEDLKNIPAIVAGKLLVIDGKTITYGDCQKEADIINKAFMETMIEGDSEGRGFAYPIPTYSITKDFKWDDSENNRLLFEMAGKYGAPYFSNYINSDMKPSDVRSMCCRLRLDLRELRKQNGGNFGAGENTGSIGVVTINLPQIAYLAETEDDFFKRLEKVMSVAARSLDTKRKVITAYYNAGLYPYTKAYLPDGYKNHFSTIGLVGMNEACLNAKWIGCDLTTETAHQWANKVLDFMREKLSDFQELYGCLFNLEATPAESTAYRFARYDKQVYPNIITAGTIGGDPYYTNSTHLPVGATDDVFAALDIEDDMQCKYTSGTVFHCFLGEKMPNWRSAMQLVRTIAENYRLPYFTLSPVYSVCEDHGYIEGEQKDCPFCGKPTEVYSRITGYYRAVSNWNNGKASEFKERKSYDIGESFHSHDRDIDMTPDDSENAAVDEVMTDPSIPLGREDQIQSGAEYYLFKTHTCPQCKMLEEMDVLKNYPVQKVFAEDPENKAIVDQFGINSAPTLVVIHDGVADQYVGASNIIGFVNNNV